MGRAWPLGTRCRSHVGHAAHLIVPWCPFQASRPHSSVCFWLGYGLGELDRWGLPLREDGEKLNWPSRPTSPPPLPAPRNSAANRPCLEPGRQALSTGGPRATRLSPAPSSPSRPPRTQMERGSQGLSPTVYAGLQGKKFKHHNIRRKAVNGFKHSQLC
ncbi:hypothetical protein mRhiFer1_009508 [Rhinolophus ferrumequinum]|uniref:Uncharacterized protein n=1 Tax=Rhinolophus ferrumequinum TaxID=59479 RepID=A0A7J7RAK9_RHIFE|nr:hypothetical protein mRhiFer1_009508 [Rhinolophus ferrumequinum]